MPQLFSDPLIELLEDSTSTDEIMAQCRKRLTPCPFIYITGWATGWPEAKHGNCGKTPWNKGMTGEQFAHFRGKKHNPESQVKRVASWRKSYDSSFQKTPEYRERLRKQALGNRSTKGQRWYNNGTKNTLAFDCPEGFRPGQLRHR